MALKLIELIMSNMSNNEIIPFTILNNAVRGRIIKLDNELNKILNQHHYPDPINKILTELLIASAIIGSQFKEEIILSVQLQSEHAVKYVIADFQSPNQIRGYAQFDNKLDYSNISYEDIISNGIIIVTIDRILHNNQRYQGIIEISNLSITKSIEKYFAQSEQIKTLFKIAVGNYITPGSETLFCAGGIMIQKLPSRNDGDDDENWREAQAYFATIKDHELIDPELSSEKLLYSLYHEVEVKVYDYLPIINKCRCSRKKAEEVLVSLGKKEVSSLLVENLIEINCQFCNQSQKFSSEDVKEMFLSASNSIDSNK